FLMNSELDPKDILAFSGMDTEDYSKYLLTASIVGYFNEALREFKHPRTMPDSGELVYLAEESILKDVSKKLPQSPGSATVGAVLGTDVPVVLSVRDIVSQHLSIIAA